MKTIFVRILDLLFCLWTPEVPIVPPCWIPWCLWLILLMSHVSHSLVSIQVVLFFSFLILCLVLSGEPFVSHLRFSGFPVCWITETFLWFYLFLHLYVGSLLWGDFCTVNFTLGCFLRFTHWTLWITSQSFLLCLFLCLHLFGFWTLWITLELLPHFEFISVFGFIPSPVPHC